MSSESSDNKNLLMIGGGVLSITAVAAAYAGYKFLGSKETEKKTKKSEKKKDDVDKDEKHEKKEDEHHEEDKIVQVDENDVSGVVEVEDEDSGDEIVLPPTTEEEERIFAIKSRISRCSNENEMIHHMLTNPVDDDEPYVIFYMDKLISNYIVMAEEMKKAGYSKDKIMATEREAAKYRFNLAVAKINDNEHFLALIESTDKLLEDHPASSSLRFEVTKLKVKYYIKNGNYSTALETIDDHLNQILEQDEVELEEKKNFLSLLSLKAKTLFVMDEYLSSQSVLMNALKFCAEYQMDPVQLYAELASSLFANGQTEDSIFDTINETIGMLENGHEARYRSQYFKTVKCGVLYVNDETSKFFIELKTKRPNMKHYYGLCYFGHTDEEYEAEPVLLKLEPKKIDERTITFKKIVPTPQPGQCEVHIEIYADKSLTTQLGAHYQVFFVFAKTLTGKDLQEHFQF